MRNFLLLLLLLSAQLLSAQNSYSDGIWYNKPAQFFEDALPVGNGRMGGMVYGGIAQERISLNEATLWSGYPVDPNMNPAAKEQLPAIRKALFDGDYKKADSLTRFIQGKYSSSYAPLGNLYIDFGIQHATSYFRSLDFSSGKHIIRFEADSTIYTREVFVSYPDQLMLIRLTATGKHKLNLGIGFNSLLQYNTESELGA